MATIKAIETTYNNNRFRSRLEARWAVFFDVLGIPYEYEPEGFELPPVGTVYDQERGFIPDESTILLYFLPDFWLPEQKYFIEVLPTIPSEEIKEKCRRLAAWSCRDNGRYQGAGMMVMAGAIPAYPFRERESPHAFRIWSFEVWDKDTLLGPAIDDCEWQRCPHCQKWQVLPIIRDTDWRDEGTLLLIEEGGTPNGGDWYMKYEDVTRIAGGFPCGCFKKEDKMPWFAPDQPMHAYKAARQARFEFGAQGQVFSEQDMDHLAEGWLRGRGRRIIKSVE